jgi:hypothetical protein
MARDRQPARRWRRLLSARYTVPVLLVVHYVLAISSIARKSATFDEVAHVVAGYSYWKCNDYRLNPENGNLPQRWMALPLLAGGHRFPATDGPAWWQGDHWQLGHRFLYTEGNRAESILLEGRAAMALLGVAVCAAVYFWSRRLFGHIGGLVSLTLCALSPTILAHGRLMTSDMAVALFLLVSLGCFWAVLHRATPWTTLASSLAMGAACLAKASGALVVPLAVALAAIRLAGASPLRVAFRRARVIEGRGRQALVILALLLIHAVVVVAMVWACFGLRYKAFASYEPGRDRFILSWEQLTDAAGATGAVVEFARDHRLLPEAYLYGIANVAATGSRRAFLSGRWGTRFAWFFPFAFLVKTPIATLAVLILAVAGAVAKWLGASGDGARSPREALARAAYDTAPLLLLFVVYSALAAYRATNIGHRHILPLYPVLFTLAGAAAFWLKARWRYLKALLLALLAWVAVEAALIWPHYLAYFNQFVGGPRHGYRHLVDSSLDWGQDLPGLKRWLEQHGYHDRQDAPVHLAYFGTGDPDYYGIRAVALRGLGVVTPQRQQYPPVAWRGGLYCVSATILQGIWLAAWGEWAVPYERTYQQLRPVVESLKRNVPDLAALQALAPAQRQAVLRHVKLFDQLRLARLCAFLRRREPDDHIGYSILIYRMTDQQVRSALFGPPVELADEPVR